MNFWQEAAAANLLDARVRAMQAANLDLQTGNQDLSARIAAAGSTPVIQRLAQDYGWVSPHDHTLVIVPAPAPSVPPAALRPAAPAPAGKPPWWVVLWQSVSGN